MNKILTIASTEYVNALRSKAFLIGLLAMPLMVGLMILVPQLTKDKIDLSDRRFAIVDFSERLGAVIARQAEERNNTGIFSNGDEQKTKRKQVQPRFIPELVAPGNVSWEGLVLQLSDRVREKELFAFVLIGEKATDPGAEERIAYHTQTPTFQALPSWLEQTINQEARRIRFEREGLDSRLIQEITRQVQIERLGLASQSESGEIQKAKKENRIATFAIPAVSIDDGKTIGRGVGVRDSFVSLFGRLDLVCMESRLFGVDSAFPVLLVLLLSNSRHFNFWLHVSRHRIRL